jgi:hypothetical protein
VGDDVVQIACDPRSLALDGQEVHLAGRRNLSPAHLGAVAVKPLWQQRAQRAGEQAVLLGAQEL